ncbi:MAG: hypothetical protein FWG27_05845 [Treponema sp.]|nr:hypothetical protein [Treponema sp.]
MNRSMHGSIKRLIIFLFLIPISLYAQETDNFENSPESGSFSFSEDSFGFFTEEDTIEKPIKIGGEVSAQVIFFTDGFGSSEKLRKMELGDIFMGKLNFSASGKIADGIINIKITPDFYDGSPFAIDEAFLRFYLGPVDIEGGLRKLTWGRADSFGPLDVINPIDYRDPSAMADPRSIKIARPMLHVSWNMGSFSKLEGVFVPWFSGDEFAFTGRWIPSQVSGLRNAADFVINFAAAGLPPEVIHGIQKYFDDLLKSYNPKKLFPKTDAFEYAQTGLRFTTTVGETDFGVQYYYGRFFRPAYVVDLEGFITSIILGTPDPERINIVFYYNYYHQIGVDFARVIAGFNFRAEAGMNITSDIKGDDGTVNNPQIVWSLGFDRDIIWGVNLNLQGNGLVRLMYNKIGSDPQMTDTEAGMNRSSTRITAVLFKKIFRDELEVRIVGLWGIEDKDFLVIPAIVWSKHDIRAEFSAGFFGGDRSRELGQYRDNGYLKTLLTWSF